MRGRSQQTLLQVLAEAVIDRKSDYQGGNARGDSGNGNPRNDANESLASLGTEVSRGDEEFETHSQYPNSIQLGFATRDYSRTLTLHVEGLPHRLPAKFLAE